MSQYILAIDQGTTSCRAIIYDSEYHIVSQFQKEFTQYFPQEGWVEHDAIEIWNTQLMCVKTAMEKAGIKTNYLDGIGITNQRETIVAWNRKTGLPIYRAIVWQDRRTSKDCDVDAELLGLDNNRTRTGLNLDAYFSASKIRWILKNIPEAKIAMDKGDLAVGTIDSWLMFKFSGGQIFSTDYSNASRTNLFHISDLKWDQTLLDYYQIPISILPEVKDSIGEFGMTDESVLGAKIRITGVAGDQQAALYGHECFQKGMIKNTFGTGCFLLQNIGNQCQFSNHHLLTTIAWKEGAEIVYAMEGSVFHAGSALKWIKENLQLIRNYSEIEDICLSISDTDGVYLVPAFTGLGAPYWDMQSRGIITGLTRNTNKSHIVRATIESLAYQTRDILDTMRRDSGIELKELRVDGGVSESKFLLQFLADILQIPVVRSQSKECTALGAAKMAAKVRGWKTMRNIENEEGHYYSPKMKKEDSEDRYQKWLQALAKCQTK